MRAIDEEPPLHRDAARWTLQYRHQLPHQVLASVTCASAVDPQKWGWAGWPQHTLAITASPPSDGSGVTADGGLDIFLARTTFYA